MSPAQAAPAAPVLEGESPGETANALDSRAALHVRVLAGSLQPTAGSHIYNAELIRRLANRGHRVSVVTLDSSGFQKEGVEVFD